MSSFSAPHFAGTDLDGALARCRPFIEKVKAGVPDRLQTFAGLQLWDSYRLAVASKLLGANGAADPDVPVEAMEVLARKILEHAIIAEYAADTKDGTVVERFLRTSSESLSKVRGRKGPKATGGVLLPDYRQMAKSQPGLYALYERWSHLSHPRTAHPHIAAEQQSGLGHEKFFAERATRCKEDVAQILHIMCDNCWRLGL